MARIALIIEASSGGVGTHVADLALSLLDRGHCVRLIYSLLRGDSRFTAALAHLRAYPEFSELCIPIRHQPHPWDALSVLRIAMDLRRSGPFDVVHCHSTKAGLVGRLGAFGSGTRVIYTPHTLLTMSPDLGALARRLSITLDRLLSFATDELIAVSPDERRHMLQIGLSRCPSRVVANGIELGTYSRNAEQRLAIRRGLGLQASETCVGFIGRLVPAKNVELLLRSFQLASRATDHARLVLVGSGPLEEGLRQLAKSLHLGPDQVIWCGDRNAADVLPAFDVFALPSRFESCPYVVIEAMAQGIPIVATNVGGLPMLVQEGFNGRLVNSGDVDAFGNALKEMCSDSRLRVAMGRNSLIQAQQFSLKAMVDAVEEVYGIANSRPLGWVSQNANSPCVSA